MWFKGCPRCGGDVVASQDIYGAYIQCVQCGFLKDAPLQPSMVRRAARPVPALAQADRRSA